MFQKIYQNLIILKPKITLSILILILLGFTYFAKNFQLDASSDTLLLENDPDLKYLRDVSKKYGSKDYFVLTYTPENSFLEPSTIKNLTNLKNDLKKLIWVDNIITILDVPLLNNNDDPLADRIKNFKTLTSENVDKERGFKEIINSPIYKELVISKDGKTSGILVYIKRDKKMSSLIKSKNEYLDQLDKSFFSNKDKKSYKNFIKEYDLYKKKYNKKNHQNVKEIRNIIKEYQGDAKIHLGGIPMIADDMMTYVKNDIIADGLTKKLIRKETEIVPFRIDIEKDYELRLIKVVNRPLNRNDINKMGIIAYIKMRDIIDDYEGANTLQDSPVLIIIPNETIEDVEDIDIGKKIKIKVNATRIKFNADKIQIVGTIIN